MVGVWTDGLGRMEIDDDCENFKISNVCVWMIDRMGLLLLCSVGVLVSIWIGRSYFCLL